MKRNKSEGDGNFAAGALQWNSGNRFTNGYMYVLVYETSDREYWR